MKCLYLDLGMGASGDMIAAALLELLSDQDAFVEDLNSLGIPGVKLFREKQAKSGILGTHMKALVHDEEQKRCPADIRSIVNNLPFPAMVKLDILSVYEEIAQAESHVHGVPGAQNYLVDGLDTLAEVTAVCLLMNRLNPDRVIASPVHVGSEIYGELCTPTGAALIRHFVTEFSSMPVIKIRAIGYGMGEKDFPRVNCLRALLGDTEDPGDSIVELCCSVDDMTGEAIGFALEETLRNGALDAFTVPVCMKQSRPGTLITVLCRWDQKEIMAKLLLCHTTTLGVREFPCRRYTLNRRMETVDSPYGPVRKKISTGYGIHREKYEYDDLSRIAREQNCSLAEILDKL